MQDSWETFKYPILIGSILGLVGIVGTVIAFAVVFLRMNAALFEGRLKAGGIITFAGTGALIPAMFCGFVMLAAVGGNRYLYKLGAMLVLYLTFAFFIAFLNIVATSILLLREIKADRQRTSLSRGPNLGPSVQPGPV